MTNSILSLQEILDCETSRELEVKGIGIIKVKDPSNEDRIKSNEDAKKDPRWTDASPAEKKALVLDYLALRIIVEPLISIETYMKGSSLKITNIIDAVIIDYTTRSRKLADKRSKELQSFLELMKENNPENSISS